LSWQTLEGVEDFQNKVGKKNLRKFYLKTILLEQVYSSHRVGRLLSRKHSTEVGRLMSRKHRQTNALKCVVNKHLFLPKESINRSISTLEGKEAHDLYLLLSVSRFVSFSKTTYAISWMFWNNKFFQRKKTSYHPLSAVTVWVMYLGILSMSFNAFAFISLIRVERSLASAREECLSS